MRHARRPAWLLVLVVGLWLPTGWAVDPLPPELRNGPEQQKLEYLQRRGEQSSRERAAVALERYQATERFQAAIAAGLAQELEARRQDMYGTGRPGDVPLPGHQELERSQMERTLRLPLAVLVVCILVYHFRERIFRRFYA